jgi:catechol 2,3-dioxygenase-like lactoylglutathione lyase family enzyme
MDVSVNRLDHVNLRTTDLDGMAAWYRDMLGLTAGPRPPFPFPGVWLYAGKHPLIHLVACETPPGDAEVDLRLEHFALSATGLKKLIARADAAGVRCIVRRVPDFPIVQVNLWDPDGNHLHVDFDLAEADGLDLE